MIHDAIYLVTEAAHILPRKQGSVIIVLLYVNEFNKPSNLFGIRFGTRFGTRFDFIIYPFNTHSVTFTKKSSLYYETNLASQIRVTTASTDSRNDSLYRLT